MALRKDGRTAKAPARRRRYERQKQIPRTASRAPENQGKAKSAGLRLGSKRKGRKNHRGVHAPDHKGWLTYGNLPEYN
jgi:hypothetical protein